MRVLLIHSPQAGHQGQTAEDIASLLKGHGYDVEVRTPEDPDFADEVKAGADLVVAAGGDGTITKVVLAAQSGATIGIIPLGTANNIANSLGIRGSPAEIVAGWSSAPTVVIDVWRARGPWGERTFIEGCGLGALTRAAHHMDDHEIAGHSSDHEISIARAALMKALGHSEPVTARLVIDGRVLEGRFLMLEMLNFGAVGPRLPLVSMADPSDGWLEIGYTLEEHYNDLCEWLSGGASPMAAAPIIRERGRQVDIVWKNARFRVGDDYWPERGAPEKSGTHEAFLRLASPGSRILAPRVRRPNPPGTWNPGPRQTV